MTFPTVPNTTNGRIVVGTQADTTATRTFPAFSGLTFSAGDLLIAIIGAYQSSTTNAQFSGWSQSFTEIHDSGSSSTMAIGVAYKIASGTETGSLTVTQAATITGHADMILMSIPAGQFNTGTAPQVSTRASSTNSNSDPPSLTASWGAEDNLWIAVSAVGETSLTGSFQSNIAGPSGWTDYLESGVSADAIGACGTAVAFLQANAATQDPPTFNTDTSNARWGAVTIAVRPGAQNATATPSVVASTSAVATVNPVVKAAAVAAATAIATLTGNIVPNLAAVASIPTPTISDGSSSATATPSVVGASTSIPTPAVATGSATATPTRVSAAATIPTPSVQGNPTWFTSLSDGVTPVLLVSAEDWGILPNGGLNHGGDFAATYEDYFTSREAQGYNSILTSVFSFTSLTGGANGPDSDGTYPFNTNSTDPTHAANTTFWGRRDSFLSSAASHGFRVILNVTTPLLEQGAFTASWTNTQWTAFGTFLAGRYASQSNIVWMVGDDYFDSIDSGLDALLAALRAGGANQPISIQNYQESSSRRDIFNNGTRPWGNTNAQYNFGYSYNVSYDVVEKMGNESNPLPYFWGDGTFLNTGGITGLTDKQLMRRLVWWALSSGSKGFQVGDNNIWTWDSTSLAEVTSNTFYTNVVPAIASYFRSLPNWHLLKADTSNLLVTAGRGTHASPLTSGGSGGQYLSNSDAYVTASRTPTGSLAVIYMSHGSTITIDESKMVAGYVATWVDPKTCATSAATPGSTYNSTAKGNNSDGQADWVLVLQAPTGVTATPTVVSAVTTVPAAAPKTGETASTSVVSAATSVPSPAIKTGATVTPSAVNATTNAATPTITSRATVSPTVVGLAASVTAPTVGAGVTATPSVVAATTAIPAPTVSVSGNATATPTVVAGTASIPAPTVSAASNATATPSVVTATASIATPSITSRATVGAAVVNAAAAIAAPTVTVSSSATVSPTVVPAVTSIASPAVSAGGSATASASTTNGVAVVPTPAVSVGVRITTGVVSAVAAVPTPTVTSSASVGPTVLAAVATIPTPAVTAGGNATVSAATVPGTATVAQPAVGTGSTVTPTRVSPGTVVATPTVTSPATVSTSTVNATTSTPTPTVSAASNAQAQPDTVQARVTATRPGVTAVGNDDGTPVEKPVLTLTTATGILTLTSASGVLTLNDAPGHLTIE